MNISCGLLLRCKVTIRGYSRKDVSMNDHNVTINVAFTQDDIC